MAQSVHYILFTLEDRQYGLPLPVVERIVRMVAPTPLPSAPDMVLGLMNLQGKVLPMVNIRKRFGLPDRSIQLSDRLIITRVGKLTVALIVEAVEGVVTCGAEELVAADEILPDIDLVNGVDKMADGMVVVLDPSRIFCVDTETKLTKALIHLSGEGK